MGYNLVTNIEACLLFRDLVPLSLIHLSHVPIAIVSLLIGVFVISKSQELSSKILFSITVVFSIWLSLDLLLWEFGYDSPLTMFSWSLLGIFFDLFFVLSLYFFYVFLDKRDVSFSKKLLFIGSLLPAVIFTPTIINLVGFDGINCEPIEGRYFITYNYSLGVIVSFWVLILAFLKYRKAEKEFKKQILLLTFGIGLLLTAFSWSNIIGSITLDWYLIQYGLFGMPVFLGFLVYLIVRYRAFDIKLLGVQALTITQFILISSMLFFAKSEVNRILTLITLLITTGAGWFLVKSVKKEIERKEELQVMSDRLASANQELKRLDNAKSEFISIASHQLRTPLTAIKGYTSLILEGSYGKIDNQLQDVVNKVYAANSRLIELVENLLSISRLESGRMQYNYQSVQLADVVNDAAGMFAVIAKKKGIDLQVLAPETPLPFLSLDAGKIREVVSNLIDNALKYTESGSVTVKMEQVEDGKVRLSVKDTGIGIKKEDLEHIFLKFARSKETEKLYVGGTGLGLYVGRTFIEKHGGRLWAESEGHGHGAEFIFELPISREGV